MLSLSKHGRATSRLAWGAAIACCAVFSSSTQASASWQDAFKNVPAQTSNSFERLRFLDGT
ncbi:MAG TPA: hypothetical protein VFL13_12310, partial [Candidatus Baltobacteraceae bacterium]|nr:hypothetical protein [Candidatus Baltobacteraceae bacterium]